MQFFGWSVHQRPHSLLQTVLIHKIGDEDEVHHKEKNDLRFFLYIIVE